MTTTKIDTVGFVAIDNAIIWGCGCTAEMALIDASLQAEMASVTLSKLRTLPATGELLNAVDRGVGGSLKWRTVAGVAVLA